MNNRILSTRRNVIQISSNKLTDSIISETEAASEALKTFELAGMVAITRDSGLKKALHLVTCNIGDEPKSYKIELSNPSFENKEADLLNFLNHLIKIEPKLEGYRKYIHLFNPINENLRIRRVAQFQGLHRGDIKRQIALKQAELTLAAICNDDGNGEFIVRYSPTL